MSDIVRVFQATARAGKESAFRDFLINEAIPIVRRHAGLVSVQVGLPSDGLPQDFLMVTTWRDLESLNGFAGENWTEAVIDPRAAPLLAGARVYHYVDAPQ